MNENEMSLSCLIICNLQQQQQQPKKKMLQKRKERIRSTPVYKHTSHFGPQRWGRLFTHTRYIYFRFFFGWNK
ncbi:hypothetical protein DERP_006005 [Dermatophagoides pteronyssinus]|uniref:Uncharacterized protein n=1 Tax=Dermatophagoides pteronyssinus TaxID=6956 RepID=A0ABQ8JT03_DERPT|nr:hypothetical protein DERP_006005 [Dermatophagoides pteronyssinus]